MYSIIERGSPCPILLVMSNQSEEQSSKCSLVFLPDSSCLVYLTISGGSHLHFMLCSSLSVMAFGKAPSMSKKRADATLPCLHALHTVDSSRCSESSIVWPGRPSKWVDGRRLCISRIYTVWSAMITNSSFAVVLRRAMGQ